MDIVGINHLYKTTEITTPRPMATDGNDFGRVLDAAKNMKIGQEAGKLFASMHNSNQDVIEYTGEMARFYFQGKDGSALDVSMIDPGTATITPDQALAAYNAGRGNVKNWTEENDWSYSFHDIDAIPFKETREYVRQVIGDRKKYRELYPE